MKYCILKIYFTEICPHEMRITEVRLMHVCLRQHRSSKAGFPKIGFD